MMITKTELEASRLASSVNYRSECPTCDFRGAFAAQALDTTRVGSSISTEALLQCPWCFEYHVIEQGYWS